MKIFIQTTNIIGENISVVEKEVADLDTARKDLKIGEKIHICRHDEGLPCSLE